MRRIFELFLAVFDLLLSPLIYLSGILLYFVRRVGIHKLKISKIILIKIGVFPIRDHYYEPLFDPKHLRYSMEKNREMPGLDLNIEEQLRTLSKFNYQHELLGISDKRTNNLDYYYENISFGGPEAEYLYSIIRLYKPKKIVEIGSGNSTLIAIKAITKNKRDNTSYNCRHICIEPFECKWLEKVNVEVIRKRVEDINKDLFSTLEANDILFIDSSHIIRPQGDVLFEYLEILPILNKGVLIHLHDIFTPKDYPYEWRFNRVLFWDEQYLLEAFLSFNSQFKIIGALNYLKHQYFDKLADKCPILTRTPDAEPCSFWIIKN